MRASLYAQAFHELVASKKIGEETLVKQFVATVAANGHAHLLPKIVRSLGEIERKEEKKETIEVASAKELSTGDVTELLKREPFKHALSPLHKKVVRKTDPTLVGGTIVRTGALRIDASYKRSLLELYRHITEEL